MGFGIKDHPFPVEAHFDQSLVLTYAVEKEKLEHLLPPCLELDTFQDTYAFVAMAVVSTKHLRPKGFPKIMGQNFNLIGYRIFVKYHTSYGKRLRGLYIIKSETDSKRMEFAGNIFTHYNYTTTDIAFSKKEDFQVVSSEKSGFEIEFDSKKDEIDLPKFSPFETWKEARRFAGPLPFTFTYNEDEKSVLIIEGVRSNWKPRPVDVKNVSNNFIDSLNLKGIQLANAFIVEDIPYWWRKGKEDKWKP